MVVGMENDQNKAILLVTCPDQRGLVHKFAEFIFKHNGNIIKADHHTDFESNLFLTRIEWNLDGFKLVRDEISEKFQKVAKEINATWQLHFTDKRPRIAVFVSKQSHCLYDLFWRVESGEFRADIPLVISNHDDLEKASKQFGADFHHVPVEKENKAAHEQTHLNLLEKYSIDLVVLAKYMQIVSPEFLSKRKEVINIHHSFLPAFPGGNPYRRAYDRGVKMIGATAHYVTEELDAGPIIEQDIEHVSHRDSLRDFVLKGKDVERLVLARGVKYHLERKVLVYQNKTVVFR